MTTSTTSGTGTRLTGYISSHDVALYVLDCANCGVVFALNTDYERRRRDDCKEFCCPNGHTNSWYETEAHRLKKRLTAAEESSTYWRAEYAEQSKQLTQAKGQLTRARNRAKAGMCIACRRTFQNYAEHMRKQHSGSV